MILPIIAELERRAKPKFILDSLFEEQQEVSNCNSRKIAILCSRRSGKSHLSCALMIIKCLKERSRCLYLGLTFASINRIAFEIILQLCEKFNIKVKPNKSLLLFEFENGSIIELAGAENIKADRFLGAAFDIIIIDEAASFSPEQLDYLIDSILMPTLIDRRGKIYLVGTPRRIESGRYYEVTTSCPNDWEVFKWGTDKNPYVAEQFQEEIESMKAANPNIEAEPFFIREYLGQWCKDITDNVYKFNPNLNLISDIPEGEWRYILGVDIGWVDACAFVLTGWKRYDNKFYILKSQKKSAMLIEDIAEVIKVYIDNYQPLTIVCDTANRTVAEELQHRYSIPIISAEKTNKDDWIEVMNTEFILNRIKVVQTSNADYIEEISKLQWDYLTNGKRVEHPGHPNDCCDSGYYAFRHAYPYLERPEVKKTEEDRMFEAEVARVNKKGKNWRI